MEASTLTQIDPSTHMLALAIIIIVAVFVAIIFAGAALYEKTAKEQELDAPDPVEIDDTYYPDDDSVIFRQ